MSSFNGRQHRHRPIYLVIFLVVVAPIGAATIITTLLLFGAEPHRVFIFGHLLKSGLDSAGIQTPNAIGVLATVFVWWLLIVMIGLIWERVRRRTQAR